MLLTRRDALAAGVLTLCALASTSAAVSVRADERPVVLAVVVAKDGKLSELSLYELKRLYIGEPVSVDGKRLIPINYAPLSKDRVGFDRVVLGMSPDEAARYWIDRRIRGQSGPPITVDSPDIAQRVLVHLGGTIGYVRPNALNADVKVIRIDGKLPGDKDYSVGY